MGPGLYQFDGLTAKISRADGMDRQVIDKLKEIAIDQVAEKLGLNLDSNYHGQCPTGHKSKSGKCFSLNIDGNYFNCFHCNIGGDNIKLVEITNKVEFPDACKWFAENFLPELLPTITNITQTKDAVDYTRQALFSEVYEFGRCLLYTDAGKISLNYLTEYRKYCVDNLRKTEWMYYNANMLNDHLLKKHPDKKDLIESLKIDGYENDDYALAFPYRNRRGFITGFVKRNKNPNCDHDKRWLSTKGTTKDDLYNLHRCKNQKSLIVVEGTPEALYFHTLGINNVVATSQGSISKKHLEGLLANKVENIILAYDNDNAGIENTAKSIISLASTAIKTYVVDPVGYENHKDPDEIYRANGNIESFKELINKAEKAYGWLYRHITTKHDITTDIGKDKAFKELREFMNLVSDTSITNELMTLAEKSLGIKQKPAIPTTEIQIDIEDFPVINNNIVNRYIDIWNPVIESPKSYLAMSFLTALTMPISRKVYMFNGSVIHCNLFTLLVGDPNVDRKTTAENKAVELMIRVDPTFLLFTGLASYEGLLGAMSEKREDMVTPNRVLIKTGEFITVVLKSRNDSTSNLLIKLNEIYDCGPLPLANRTLGKPMVVYNHFGSLLGTSQPHVIESTFREGDIYSGFGSRFCYVFDHSNKIYPRPTEPDYNEINDLVSNIQAVKEFVDNLYSKNNNKPFKIEFDSESEKIWDNYYTECKKKIKTEPPHIAGLMQRMDIFPLKMVMLFTMLDQFEKVIPENLVDAINITDWLRVCVYRLFGEFGQKSEDRVANRILNAIRKHGPLNKRDIQQLASSKEGREIFNKALKLLVDSGELIAEGNIYLLP